MRKVMVYKRFERFWHWSQALLVLALAVTGFQIRYGCTLISFEETILYHKILAWAFVILIIFAAFWHFTTGEWRQYIPMPKQTGAMVRFYMKGIFKGEPHPVKKTELSKLNPLQRLAYLGLKLLVIPVLVTSGFLYYYYNQWSVIGLDGMTLAPIATIHTLAAFALIAFMFAHIYLTTTGHTVTSNMKAMITGWEALEDESAPPAPAAPQED
ncbi:cytochrome b/b6 domain-containing protein [Myxococcota bacterium]|nr:cytochrome b/b6 domain-containing protein [Myxococcota bacterium]MBU1896494.1 cytochrome b/b6 domain-containing protein [Myxococcota bacterium]